MSLTSVTVSASDTSRSRWVVRIGDSVYGAYLDKEQALLDAIDAARDALQSGRDAQVWLRDHASADRVF